MADVFYFYVYDDRKIEYTVAEPIMLEDNRVTDFQFRIPKTVNGIDVSSFAWWFVYVNAAKNKYSIPLTLTNDEDEPDRYMTATYTVDYGMTIKAGGVRFAIEAINANQSGEIVNEWHTRTYNLTVHDTLQGNQVEYAETESDIISALIVQIQQKYNALVGGATPIPVASVSAMTDTSKIYLLTTDKNWYYYNGSAWVSGGLYASGIVIDPTLTQSGQAADAKVVGDTLNNTVSGSAFDWEIGTLNPGAGTPSGSNTRIRSQYIHVSPGEILSLSGEDKRLIIYTYDEHMQYTADTTWLTGNTYTVSASGYVRILIRKDTSNSAISTSEIDTLVARLSIKRIVPSGVYTDVPKLSTVLTSLDGSRYITDIEIGSLTGGKPYKDTAYVRTKEFIRVNAGDVLTVHPTKFGLYNSALYKYTTDNASGYNATVTIPATVAGNTWKYTFTDDGWFKFRASNASSGAKITPEDLVQFNDVFYLEHIYDAAELMGEVKALALDYDAINTTISGKFNIAVQTDTHMSKFVGYTSTEYLPDNFNDLRSVANAINRLNIDLFANLGDMVRGYQADPDFETRANADAIINIYKEINTNKAFVIGNHDDGCLFYSDLTYNDNPNSQQVMFPNEQFNRYTKYGLNNKGTSKYFYSDVNGVRVITLYQRDYNYSEAIPGISNFKIGSTQINWFVNTALDTDLPVIVLTHAPLVESLHTQGREGFDDILNALTSFVGGSGTIIAVLSGHTHVQNSAKVDGINHIVFKNGYDFFELISVDLTARTIACKVLNKSGLEDRSFTY